MCAHNENMRKNSYLCIVNPERQTGSVRRAKLATWHDEMDQLEKMKNSSQDFREAPEHQRSARKRRKAPSGKIEKLK